MGIWGVKVGVSVSCAVNVGIWGRKGGIWGKKRGDLGHRSGNLGRNIEGFPSAVPALCGFGAKKWEFGA